MSELNITLIKSTNGALKNHKATIAALGLRKIGQTVTKPDNAATQGMISTVAHMIKVTKD